MQAGIKLWILTGDKRETAINVGYAAQVLTQDMELLSLDFQSPEQCGTSIDNLQATIYEEPKVGIAFKMFIQNY